MTEPELNTTPTRPYLVRAIYDWINDNHLTPYLLVNADLPQVTVPIQHVKDGQIVLNIVPHAVHQFSMDNNAIQFQARFGGVSQHIYVPLWAVLGVYARENGQGLFFDSNEYDAQLIALGAAPRESDPSPEPPKNKPSLRVLD